MGEGCCKEAGEEEGERGGEPAGEEGATDTGVAGEETPCISPALAGGVEVDSGADGGDEEAGGAADSEDLTAIECVVLGVRCSRSRISSTTAALGRGRGEEDLGSTSTRPPCVAASETACLGEDNVVAPCCTGSVGPPTGCSGGAVVGRGSARWVSGADRSSVDPGARGDPTVRCACSEDAAGCCTTEVGGTTETV
jgi:hypothetical protein